MKNVIPRKVADLATKGTEVAGGAVQYGGTIPLTINTAALINGDTTPLVDAVTAQVQANTELKNRKAAVIALLLICRAFLTLARDNAKPELGTRSNARWVPTGLVGSLKIPEDVVGVIGLLRSFQTFLGANAGFEVAEKNITAVRAGELLTQLEAARNAVNMQQTQLRNMAVDREATAKTLTKRISATIAELGMRMGPLDARWLAFGLNLPGAVGSPEVPTNVTAVLVGPTAVSVRWDAAVRATSYRVWKKVVGVDAAFVAVDLRNDLDFTIEGLPANAQIQIAVSAYNATGESALSAFVTVTTLA